MCTDRDLKETSAIIKDQLIQNAAARIVTFTQKTEHITPVLCKLHWLPVQYRIIFKVLLLVFKGLARVVQRMHNASHRINHYPADSVVCFVNTYPLDSDLSGG